MLLSLAALWLPTCAAEAPPPNVVLVVLDTVRADRVGASHNQHKITPQYDRMAASGLRFEFAYATAPWTLPSHATLFTGLASSQHGTVHEHFTLADKFETLAERLSARGYGTYGITSNPWLTKTRGMTQGFKLFDAAYANNSAKTDKGAARATELAIDFVHAAAGAEQPFFLFVNYLEAHLPYAPPAEGLAAIGVPPEQLLRDAFSIQEAEEIMTGARYASAEELALAKTLYNAELAYQDQKLGALFDALRSRDLLDNTLVIVTADHGEMLGHDGMMGHEFSLSDDVLRVPLMLRLPGHFEGGGSVSTPVSHLDIVPTVLDIVGVKSKPEPLEGTSLREVLKDKNLDRPLIAEYSEPVTLLNDYWATRHPEFDTSKFATSLGSLREGPVKVITSARGDVGVFDRGKPAPLSENQPLANRMQAKLNAWTTRLKSGADSETFRN